MLFRTDRSSRFEGWSGQRELGLGRRATIAKQIDGKNQQHQGDGGNTVIAVPKTIFVLDGVLERRRMHPGLRPGKQAFGGIAEPKPGVAITACLGPSTLGRMWRTSISQRADADHARRLNIFAVLPQQIRPADGAVLDPVRQRDREDNQAELQASWVLAQHHLPGGEIDKRKRDQDRGRDNFASATHQHVIGRPRRNSQQSGRACAWRHLPPGSPRRLAAERMRAMQDRHCTSRPGCIAAERIFPASRPPIQGRSGGRASGMSKRARIQTDSGLRAGATERLCDRARRCLIKPGSSATKRLPFGSP